MQFYLLITLISSFRSSTTSAQTSLLTSSGYYIISNDSWPSINNETKSIVWLVLARLMRGVWSPGWSRSHFSQTTTTTTGYDVESMSHRVYRPYGMFTLAKRTNGHMSKSRLHNVSPALSLSLSLSFSFGTFRCESLARTTRFSYRDLNPFSSFALPCLDRHGTFAREKG